MGGEIVTINVYAEYERYDFKYSMRFLVSVKTLKVTGIILEAPFDYQKSIETLVSMKDYNISGWSYDEQVLRLDMLDSKTQSHSILEFDELLQKLKKSPIGRRIITLYMDRKIRAKK